MAETKTRAQKNRAIRQEALREQLSNKGLLQHAIELSDKISNAADQNEARILKMAFDSKMKLVDKYLPNLQSTELTGEDGQPLTINVNR